MRPDVGAGMKRTEAEIERYGGGAQAKRGRYAHEPEHVDMDRLMSGL
jgi:hypothetical protein